jgi:hypothetical protein
VDPVQTYQDESRSLDEAVLASIDRWHRTGQVLRDDEFDALALRIFAHQLTYNLPYAQYCATQGVSHGRMPATWHEIPAVPTAAYKEASFATFNPALAALVFETSGTTQGQTGRHYMESSRLYDAALMAGFDRFMLPDHVNLRFLNLVPHPTTHPHSSLGYMMAKVSDARARGASAWYIEDDVLNLDRFIADIEAAVEHDHPVCIATTAFALVHVLDGLKDRRRYFALPTGSRIMETGGFKGRSRTVERDELYKLTAERFGASRAVICAEYGMTELTSQYYDDVILKRTTDDRTEPRYKTSPPWLRPRVVGPDGKTLPNGTVGSLVHVDLANRSSCVAIHTEDLGVQFDDGLVVMGREGGATLRGCSLSAEDLVLQ